ncbi:MAG: hypothetical protein FJX66_11115 [Alphaproteobacteria bacterium]|nr:hypothetical protein [Alphaproteobacteria bacterium]
MARALARVAAIAAAGVIPVATAHVAAGDSVVGRWERNSTGGCIDGPAAQFLPNGVLVLFKGEDFIEGLGLYAMRADGTIVANRLVPWPMGEQPPENDRRRMADATITIAPAGVDALDVTVAGPGFDAPADETRVKLVRCPR